MFPHFTLGLILGGLSPGKEGCTGKKATFIQHSVSLLGQTVGECDQFNSRNSEYQFACPYDEESSVCMEVTDGETTGLGSVGLVWHGWYTDQQHSESRVAVSNYPYYNAPSVCSSWPVPPTVPTLPFHYMTIAIHTLS